MHAKFCVEFVKTRDFFVDFGIFGHEIVTRGSFKMFQESHYFFRYTKKYNHMSYSSFKIVPLCNHTLLLATVKVLETILEAVL